MVTWPHPQYNLSHVIKFHWWRHGQKLWRHKPYFKISLFQEAIFADIIKIVTIFIKTIFKDSKKLKELEIIYQNVIYICISWYIQICWFAVKNADVSGNQGLCHVIYIPFGSSLGKERSILDRVKSLLTVLFFCGESSILLSWTFRKTFSKH